VHAGRPTSRSGPAPFDASPHLQVEHRLPVDHLPRTAARGLAHAARPALRFAAAPRLRGALAASDSAPRVTGPTQDQQPPPSSDRARAMRRDRRVGALRSPRSARLLSRDCALRAHHRSAAPAWIDHKGRVHTRAPTAGRGVLAVPSRPSGRRDARAPPARPGAEVINISWKAQRRLNARWRQLRDTRHKPGGVVAVAIARELAAYCWEIATCPLQPTQLPDTPTRKRLSHSR
jgi:hypothetical protein